MPLVLFAKADHARLIAALEFLQEISSEIFEEQLNGWYRVPSVWPSERDLTTFRMWFEIGFHTTIVDLCDDPVEHDEL